MHLGRAGGRGGGGKVQNLHSNEFYENTQLNPARRFGGRQECRRRFASGVTQISHIHDPESLFIEHGAVVVVRSRSADGFRPNTNMPDRGKFAAATGYNRPKTTARRC